MENSIDNNNIIFSNPKYSYDSETNTIKISYRADLTFLLDINDFIVLLNSNKKFICDESIYYPYYKANYKQITLIEYIYKYDYTSSEYIFLNNDKNNLCRSNVMIYHKYNNKIKEKYPECEYIQGHYNNYGIDAHMIKNPMWKIYENGKEIYLMYCEKDTIIKLCKESLEKIYNEETKNNTKITWYKCDNGYIAGKINCKQYYIHQIIMNCYGNGAGTSIISVDHIDRDPLNNTITNLRIATRKEQEQNSNGIAPNTKRVRQYNARPLPEGITQNMLKKYVVYYYNVYNKKNNKAREYFCVEGHPKLNKTWETTKSNKVSIHDKLQMANKVIEDLENDIFPKTYTEQRNLPKGVYLNNMRNSPHLCLDLRMDDETRINLKMKLPEEYDMEDQLEIFKKKIKFKYNINDFEYQYEN